MAVSAFDDTRPIPILSRDELKDVWLKMSPTDRGLLLGQSLNDLSEKDMQKLMKIISKL